jgi:hypothetical protein
MEAAATPLPSEETTPPVTNMYFGPVRKGLDFLQKESRYEPLSGRTGFVSKGFRFGRKDAQITVDQAHGRRGTSEDEDVRHLSNSLSTQEMKVLIWPDLRHEK